jgi:predicted amidophosphoribosyltransferase
MKNDTWVKCPSCQGDARELDGFFRCESCGDEFLEDEIYEEEKTERESR